MPKINNCPNCIVDSVGKLFHFTHMDNKKFLLREKKMLPASELLAREPDKKRWLEKKRKNCVVLSDGRVIRDQKPFNRGVEWEGGISESEFLKLLNEHVFFWTKADVQRQTKGGGFSKKYQDSAVVVVSFADIIRENPNLPGFFCLCNSGAPRHANGVTPRRGIGTFIPCCEYRGAPGKIREVCLRGVARISKNVKIIRASDVQFSLFPKDGKLGRDGAHSK